MANYQLRLEGSLLGYCDHPDDGSALRWANELIGELLEGGSIEDGAEVKLYSGDRLVDAHEKPN